MRWSGGRLLVVLATTGLVAGCTGSGPAKAPGYSTTRGAKTFDGLSADLTKRELRFVITTARHYADTSQDLGHTVTGSSWPSDVRRVLVAAAPRQDSIPFAQEADIWQQVPNGARHRVLILQMSGKFEAMSSAGTTIVNHEITLIYNARSFRVLSGTAMTTVPDLSPALVILDRH
jgi:hypothetical protein